MRTSNSRLVPALCALALALAMTSGAFAECGSPTKLAKPSAWQPQVGAARVQPVELPYERFNTDDAAAIVGMWHVTFTANTSNGDAIPAPGMMIDNALVVWHSDGTEIMNSIRSPQDGNFCMGVWQKTGDHSYYLNHFAWFANQWPNNTNNGIGMPVGPTHITERVDLSPDGNHFSGTFTLDAYDATGTIDVQSFTGAISGTRITVDTTIGDLL